MSICKQLIDVAVDAGCDAVKFQKRDINEVYTKQFLDLIEKAHGAKLKESKRKD